MRLLLLAAAVTLAADPLIIGHRGCRALRPENTLPAFVHALASGADMLELDVVVTRDDRLVVHHDLELEGKHVRDLTLAEVRAFDRGATPSKGFPKQTAIPGTRIPELREVLAFARDHGARLMVETKVDPRIDPEWFAAAIDSELRTFGLSEKTLLQSFDHRTLHAMRRRNPDVGLVLLNPAKVLDDYIGPARALGPGAIQFVNFRVITPEIVKQLHAAGIPVFSGTTDDPAIWKRLREIGVNGILTDDPEALARCQSHTGCAAR